MLSSKKIKISVAVVLYNPTIADESQTLENIKKLDSINCFDFKFYLIDNASPKRKMKINIPSEVNNIYLKYLNINNGFGAGHNSILNKLDSNFHIIMNPDIKISDISGFTKAIEYIQSHKDIALLSPLVRNMDNGKIQYLNRKEPTVFDLLIRFLGPNFFPKRQLDFIKKKDGYDHIQVDENATGSFMILRTSTFKNIKGFDEDFFMYFEDTDLTKRISKKGKVLFYPYFTVIHGWKRENHSLSGIRSMIKSMIIYFNKWGWRWF